MKIVSFHRGTTASAFFALVVMLVTTCSSSSSSTTSFAAAAASPNSNGDNIADGDTTTTTTSDSSRIQDTIFLHLRGGGGQDEKVTTITTTGACTTSCKNGKTCTPESDRCNRLYSVVCGCNGREYTNTCEAFKAGVNVRHVGACGSSEEDEDIDVIEEEGVVGVGVVSVVSS